MDRQAPDPLQLIRRRIDAADAEIHRLLMERAAVIDELIHVKGTSMPGAAFRPDREADMMRRLVARHSGVLPLASVEHIWRELISTFTAMQAPYGVVTPPGDDPLALRDLVRFYFGFHVPVHVAPDVAAALADVAREGRDLAVVPLATKGRWWAGLIDPDAPKIFARLPFLEMPDRPAALPAYVAGPPLTQKLEPDIRLLVLKATAEASAFLAYVGGRIAGEAEGEFLAEIAADERISDFPDVAASPTVGGFAAPIRVGSLEAAANSGRAGHE